MSRFLGKSSPKVDRKYCPPQKCGIQVVLRGKKLGIQVIFKDWGKDKRCMALTRKRKEGSRQGRREFPPHVSPLKRPKAEIVKTPTSFQGELKDVWGHRKCDTVQKVLDTQERCQQINVSKRDTSYPKPNQCSIDSTVALTYCSVWGNKHRQHRAH